MSLPIEIRENRQEALRRLMKWGSSTIDDYEEETEEDVRPYFAKHGEEGYKQLGRYALATSTQESIYFYVFDERREAEDRGDEYIADGICPEWPLRIVDLDTGQIWVPSETRTQYKPIRR